MTTKQRKGASGLSFCIKMTFFIKKLVKNLVMSKKSSNFAAVLRV